jgi:hypothetical protein
MRAFVFALLILLPTIASGDDARLRQCRALEDRAQRLDCYDAIPLVDTAADSGTASAGARESAAASEGAAAGRAAASSASSASSAPAPAAASGDAAFGLPRRSVADATDSIRSAVAPGFKGWNGGSHIALENGQVWKVVDGSTGVVGPDIRQVTVERGFMGVYYLRFDGMNKAPKVERVR